jgi:hypothetical protein
VVCRLCEDIAGQQALGKPLSGASQRVRCLGVCQMLCLSLELLQAVPHTARVCKACGRRAYESERC